MIRLMARHLERMPRAIRFRTQWNTPLANGEPYPIRVS